MGLPTVLVRDFDDHADSHKTFNEYWIEWMNSRLERHHQTDSDIKLKIVRYAADRIGSPLTEVEDESETQLLKQELIAERIERNRLNNCLHRRKRRIFKMIFKSIRQSLTSRD